MPAWGPADLAAALAPRPVAILAGLWVGAQRCTLVAWDLGPELSSLEAALAATSRAQAHGPSLLGAAVGTIGWEGGAHFHVPSSAALFQPGASTVWVRGDLPIVTPQPPAPGGGGDRTATPLWPREGFCDAVRAAQAAMDAGMIEKVILSVPFEAPCILPPWVVYDRLAHRAGPGSMAFLLPDGAGGWLVGRSPEPLVHLADRRATMHLLAGTRAIGGGQEGDLTANPKDRAEHMIAVEQARRDLLAVCQSESVNVDRCMTVERHPGLIHLSSQLSGRLRTDATPSDLIRACFPAGTVGGVPRESARALIDRLEPVPRDWYAGAVGALLPDGDVQLWLTIRSLRLADGTARLRTGAGLVRESDPDREWQECLNKARPTLAAIGAEVNRCDQP